MRLNYDQSIDAEAQPINAQVKALKQAGICPTCHNFETGEVYPPADDLTFYSDDLVLCMLEPFARNPGHTIVLVKPHFEDISEMPPDIGAVVFAVIHQAIHALKTHLGAEKVYLCTMCDGARNHLHFQLIPRLPDDEIRGSALFVKPRGKLEDYDDDVTALRDLMRD